MQSQPTDTLQKKPSTFFAWVIQEKINEMWSELVWGEDGMVKERMG